MRVPENEKDLIPFAKELIDQCRVSAGNRAAYYRVLNQIAETGRYDGRKALINLLNVHLTRTAAHLFSPVELRFTIDFERKYPKRIYEMAAVVSEVLTRQWDRNSVDNLFARGVYESLKYGACILKQWAQAEGENQVANYYAKLVMPWQFGVYNESENNINAQIALCETTSMTMPEVWRRIWHLPKSEKLFERIKAHARKGIAATEPQSYFHSILSSSTLNTGTQAQSCPRPGGIVGLNESDYSLMGPVVSAPTVNVHEVWVQNELDYVTILMVEPDVVIAPLYARSNLLIKNSRLQPYRLIQANEVTNWFWGRSELVDLIEPQGLLAVWADDLRRLFSLQIDKILAFIGEPGLTDERYGQFREAGFLGLDQTAKVQDLTPAMPPDMIGMLKFLIDTTNWLGGFPDIMQGKGEAGVRAGSHANTLLKTASPRLRDQALLIERCCAVAADLTLTIREAKDPDFWWTKADEPFKDIEATRFLLTDLPDDWRVVVDSHSSSPIFADENVQLVMASHKLGIVDGEYVINNIPLPNKEAAKTSLREREAQKAAMMQRMLQEFPELGEKIAAKQLTGSKR
jgi:hypothetical protein